MLKEKPVTVPLCPSQSPHGMACERTWGFSSERPASTRLRGGMGSTDKIRISWHPEFLTMHTVVVSTVRPISRRCASDTFAKNVYSAGSTISQCDAWSHLSTRKYSSQSKGDCIPSSTSLHSLQATKRPASYAMFLKWNENGWSFVRCTSTFNMPLRPAPIRIS